MEKYFLEISNLKICLEKAQDKELDIGYYILDVGLFHSKFFL